MVESNALIDWFNVTFTGSNEPNYKAVIKDNAIFNDLLDILNIEDKSCFTRSNGVEGFKDTIVYKEFLRFRFFATNGDELINHHQLTLSGSGCKEFLSVNGDWNKLLKYCYQKDLKVTRIDLAIDLFTDKYFSLYDLTMKTMKDEYVSTPHTKRIIYSGNSKSGHTLGNTLYFGSPGSDVLCVYDKKSERYYSGFNINSNVWIRFELRLTARRSKHAIELIIGKGYERISEVIYPILNGFIEFKVYDKNNIRKDRWKTWRPWERFMKSIPGIKLNSSPIEETSIIKKMRWESNAVAKNDLVIFASDPHNYDSWKTDIMIDKVKKIDTVDLAMINKQRLSNGLSPFDTKADLLNFFNDQFYGDLE